MILSSVRMSSEGTRTMPRTYMYRPIVSLFQGAPKLSAFMSGIIMLNHRSH